VSNKAKTVVVVGPARSGTSLIAGILYLMGVDMGQEPNPSPSNPKGDFEDDDFRELNRAIYDTARAGSGYWTPPYFQEIQEVEPEFSDRVKNLVSKKREASGSIWGWKNPWNVLTIPLYIPHLENPYIITVFRDPMSVARSAVRHTEKYEKVPLDEAERVTVGYFKALRSFVNKYRDYPICKVVFEDIMQNPEREVSRISSFLGINLSPKQHEDIVNFIIPRDKIEKERRLGSIRRLSHFASLLITNPKKAIRKAINIIYRRLGAIEKKI